MRNTQLDTAMSRSRSGRGHEPLPGDEPVPIRYRPPILATLSAAIFLVLLLGLLAYIGLSLTVDTLSDPTRDVQSNLLGTGACGIVSLALVAATLYFVNAARVAALDLGAAPTHFTGTITARHTGRGRSGGYWIVIAPPTVAPPASTEQAPAPVTASPVAVATRERGFVRGTASFGEQLQGVTVAPQPVAPERAIHTPSTRRKLAPGEVNLRVDKHIYKALGPGDSVEAVFSPHLQHVYYVRHQVGEGHSLILRNLALI